MMEMAKNIPKTKKPAGTKSQAAAAEVVDDKSQNMDGLVAENVQKI